MFEGAILVVAVALYLAWFNTPRLKRPELVKEVLESARARYEVQQRYAEDRELNGFWAPVFQESLVGSPTPASQAAKTWRGHCFLGDDDDEDGEFERLDHADLLNDADYLRARADFQRVADQVDDALRRPCFVVPCAFSGKSEWDSSLFWELESAFVLLAESYLAEGDIRRAWQALLRTMKLGLLMREQWSDSWGRVLCTQTAHLLTEKIGTNHPDVDQWNALAELCREDVDHFDGFPPPWTSLGKLLGLLFLRALNIPRREWRAACNGFTELILQAREGRAFRAPEPPRFSVVTSYIVTSGQHLENTINLANLIYGSNLGLGVAAKLLAHRLERGDFPRKLANLGTGIDLQPLHWDPEKGRLLVRKLPNLPINSLWAGPPESVYGDSWMRRTEQGWLFLLR